MGKEDIDMCTEEESDRFLISSAFDDPEELDDAKDDTMIYQVKASISEEDTGLRDQELPCVENLNLDAEVTQKKKASKLAQKITNSKSLDHTMKLASKLTITGNMRSSYTVPQPFALATDKRAKKLQGNLPLTSRKPLQPDNIKHVDEEDSCSVASSTAASVKTVKGRAIAVSAPTFRSSERAEKRKEFYTKLEEKHQALEAEKNQCEARSKEEQMTALKQLRKSLTFKAAPMPSFYQEGPPKVELRKVPTTRAKSPKLGRRKSCGDATKTSQTETNKSNNGACIKAARHSVGACRTSNKVQINAKIGSPVYINKDSKPAPRTATEERNSDIVIMS